MPPTAPVLALIYRYTVELAGSTGHEKFAAIDKKTSFFPEAENPCAAHKMSGFEVRLIVVSVRLPLVAGMKLAAPALVGPLIAVCRTPDPPLATGVAHAPSPRQNVELDAPEPPPRLETGRLPVTFAVRSTVAKKATAPKFTPFDFVTTSAPVVVFSVPSPLMVNPPKEPELLN